jgi:disulfide bond formation protein DsbB
MTPLVTTVTNILSFFTVGAHVFIVAAVCAMLYFVGTRGARTPLTTFVRWMGTYVLELGFVVSASGIVLSLFYSEIADFPPCVLCWWQRIFLYPQAVLFAVALYYRRKGMEALKVVTTTSITLSVVGFCISFFQNFASIFNPGLLDVCSAQGGVSCSIIFFEKFGYITIPFMAMTSFALLLVIMGAQKMSSRTRV